MGPSTRPAAAASSAAAGPSTRSSVAPAAPATPRATEREQSPASAPPSARPAGAGLGSAAGGRHGDSCGGRRAAGTGRSRARQPAQPEREWARTTAGSASGFFLLGNLKRDRFGLQTGGRSGCFFIGSDAGGAIRVTLEG